MIVGERHQLFDHGACRALPLIQCFCLCRCSQAGSLQSCDSQDTDGENRHREEDFEECEPLPVARHFLQPHVADIDRFAPLDGAALSSKGKLRSENDLDAPNRAGLRK